MLSVTRRNCRSRPHGKMPKVHPAGLPSAHGSKKLGEIEAGGLRRYEPEGTMSESRFREVFFERLDAAIHAAEKKYALRIKALELLLYVASKRALEVARQEITAWRNATREEDCRRAWAWEVARREREEREQQQRAQQREADAGAAAVVATAAAAAAAKAGVTAVGQEMPSTGGSGGAASLLKASNAAGLLDEYVCPITAEIMTDPVCTLDGFTYERKAITEWLRTNDTSPATGARLESKNVIPNITVRCLLRHL